MAAHFLFDPCGCCECEDACAYVCEQFEAGSLGPEWDVRYGDWEMVDSGPEYTRELRATGPGLIVNTTPHPLGALRYALSCRARVTTPYPNPVRWGLVFGYVDDLNFWCLELTYWARRYTLYEVVGGRWIHRDSTVDWNSWTGKPTFHLCAEDGVSVVGNYLCHIDEINNRPGVLAPVIQSSLCGLVVREAAQPILFDDFFVKYHAADKAQCAACTALRTCDPSDRYVGEAFIPETYFFRDQFDREQINGSSRADNYTLTGDWQIVDGRAEGTNGLLQCDVPPPNATENLQAGFQFGADDPGDVIDLEFTDTPLRVELVFGDANNLGRTRFFDGPTLIASVGGPAAGVAQDHSRAIQLTGDTAYTSFTDTRVFHPGGTSWRVHAKSIASRAWVDDVRMRMGKNDGSCDYQPPGLQIFKSAGWSPTKLIVNNPPDFIVSGTWGEPVPDMGFHLYPSNEAGALMLFNVPTGTYWNDYCYFTQLDRITPSFHPTAVSGLYGVADWIDANNFVAIYWTYNGPAGTGTRTGCIGYRSGVQVFHTPWMAGSEGEFSFHDDVVTITELTDYIVTRHTFDWVLLGGKCGFYVPTFHEPNAFNKPAGRSFSSIYRGTRYP